MKLLRVNYMLTKPLHCHCITLPISSIEGWYRYRYLRESHSFCREFLVISWIPELVLYYFTSLDPRAGIL